MKPSLFVNLSVNDLAKSKHFFATLGFAFNEKFSNDDAISFVINDSSTMMLLKTEFFQPFTKLPISNAKEQTEIIMSIQVESREKVDEFVNLALTLGAIEARDSQDHGFMYSRSFHDLDGHIWEPFYMDEAAFSMDN